MKKISIINANYKEIMKLYYYNISNIIYLNTSFEKTKNLKFRF